MFLECITGINKAFREHLLPDQRRRNLLPEVKVSDKRDVGRKLSMLSRVREGHHQEHRSFVFLISFCSYTSCSFQSLVDLAYDPETGNTASNAPWIPQKYDPDSGLSQLH